MQSHGMTPVARFVCVVVLDLMIDEDNNSTTLRHVKCKINTEVFIQDILEDEEDEEDEEDVEDFMVHHNLTEDVVDEDEDLEDEDEDLEDEDVDVDAVVDEDVEDVVRLVHRAAATKTSRSEVAGC